jgi:hypothetical protein
MEYVNADMGAIAALASELDHYQSEMKRIQNQLQDAFVQLWANGEWTDANFKAFHTHNMEAVGNELAMLHSTVDNNLKPFLRDVYQKLAAYRDANA